MLCPSQRGRIKIILAPKCGGQQRSRSVVEMDITHTEASADTITSDCEIIVDLIDGSGGKESDELA